METDDVLEGFDALLWLRSKQAQYKGYEKGSQDYVRHQYFKAAADENERLRTLYHELLYAVASKYSGESRHETALRYITERENAPLRCASNEAVTKGDSG